MLGLRQSLNVKLQQQLVMTPQLQQAIKLLALSRLELIDHVREEMETNPALDEELRPDLDTLKEEAAIQGADPKQPVEATPEPDTQNEVVGNAENADDIDWKEWLDSYNSSAPLGKSPKAPAEDLPTIEQTLSVEATLQEHLLMQVGELSWVPADQQIANEIVGALDERGFLSGVRPVEEIAIRLEVSVAHVERVLQQIQALEPAGIAARDVRECLLIQLRRDGHQGTLAERLVRDYIEELENRNYQQIAREEEVSLEEIGVALRVVQALEPRPARNFSGQDSIYITPDIYVTRVGDEFVIQQNEDGMPKLRVSHYYSAALKGGMNGEAKTYVQEKLRSAEWLIRSIYQRQHTIYRVTESILKFQREFFEKGVEHLKPLILRDIAEDIGMHESTISRVTTNKYVDTPQGIFELKYFFNSSIGRSGDAGDMASVSVKHKIKQLIESEDKKRPYSDQAIVNLLKKEDIKIARRTVAKYREAMGILSSAKRRKIL